jgi:hypothetical protein
VGVISRTEREHGHALIAAWRTNNRVTTYLIENLPRELWSMSVPGSPRRTVRAIAAHLHNSRCAWIKMIGAKHGVAVPKTVNARVVRQEQLVRVIGYSSEGIIALIELAVARGGAIPPAVAELPDRSRSLPHLLRGPRSTSSRTTLLVSAAVGTQIAHRSHSRIVAMEEAQPRMTRL